MQVIHANDRGLTRMGWLHSAHSFSFGSYFNPRRMGMSHLRVLNQDRVAPDQGFDTHPHNDMEIVTYVLEGALEHRDSMGNGSVLRPGEIQYMCAGTGITHSEFNPSADEAGHFIQMWILPPRRRLAPSYAQKRIDLERCEGRLQLLVSPDGREDSIEMHQEASLWVGRFSGAQQCTWELPEGRWAYLHVARGSVMVNDVALGPEDALEIRTAGPLRLHSGEGAEVLLWDLVGDDPE
ncbi:MAG: pirin family protein [Planctomycetota bacterium]